MSQAKLRFEKVIEMPEKPSKVPEFRLKLVGMENVHSKNELPEEYLSGFPHFYRDGDRLHLYEVVPKVQPASHRSILIGDAVHQNIMKTFVQSMKIAGSRLTRINKKLSHKRENWKGTTTIKI